MDDSAVQATQGISAGEPSSEPTTLTAKSSDLLAPSGDEGDSLVQPGPPGFNSQPPSELVGSLPLTVNVDDSAVQATQGISAASAEPATPTVKSPDLLAPPSDEGDSLVQPGRPGFNSQPPPELHGELETGETRDGGQFADIAVGVLKQSDGPGIRVAIKRIRFDNSADQKRWQSRIIREVVIWQAANHPNILQFIGYKVVDGVPWLVSPWCEYGDLEKYITNHEVTAAEKLKLLCDAARGLDHLHSHTPPIVHGDIKPRNVLIKDNKEAALCDFGVSRVLVGAGAPTGLTTTGNKTGGTGGYQPKELLEGAVQTTSGDIYGFGGLILATMSGKQPFHRRKNEAARIVAVCMDEIPKPKDHPGLPANDPLWNLLRRCWSVDPMERPTIKTVLEELEARRSSLSSA